MMWETWTQKRKYARFTRRNRGQWVDLYQVETAGPEFVLGEWNGTRITMASGTSVLVDEDEDLVMELVAKKEEA